VAAPKGTATLVLGNSELFVQNGRETTVPTSASETSLRPKTAIALQTFSSLHTRNGSRSNFRLAIFALRQKIPKLCGFAAVQTGLAFAHNLNHAKSFERACDRMRFLVA
jgi:hypothetical protein